MTPPGSPEAGVVATFSASASSDPYPGGSISSYSWSWGDGTPGGSGVEPTHTYAVPGDYTVTLSVTDNYGLTSVSVTQSVAVAAEEPPAKSSANSGSQGVSGFQTSLAPVPDAELASTSLQVSSSGAVTLKVSCPAGESSCSGTVTLRTLNAVIAGGGHAARKKASVLTLAIGSFTVAGGKVRAVTLHLSAKARALLARSHMLRARATVVAHDPAGRSHTTQTIVTLRAPRRGTAKAEHRRGGPIRDGGPLLINSTRVWPQRTTQPRSALRRVPDADLGGGRR